MKHLLLLCALALSIQTLAFAQSLETGIKFYEEGDYQRALKIFEDIDEPVAHLFAGKSYFGMGNYLQAKRHLSLVNDNASTELYLEALFTRALSDFQLKNYTVALEGLNTIIENRQRTSVSSQAHQFYRKLNDFLTLQQRYAVFKATDNDAIRLDLVKSSMGKVGYHSAHTLVNAYKRTVLEIPQRELERLENMLADSVNYMQRYNPDRYPDAPEGIAYNIGVALPQFDYDSPNFEISQNMYFGIQLAIENFNSSNNDKKAFITYKNTNADTADAETIFNELVWDTGVDALLGPLFSNEATEFSRFAEQYEIPMLTPLANSDNLNLDLSYTFQLNPTFGNHGLTMARYAVQTLEYDTMAVIVEKGSLGEASAIAFRDEVRNLGGEVVRYYSKDLESQGYDISEFSEYLDEEADTLFNYNIDAVYAPFTGQAASTLISALITHLEALRSDVAILGSEEWETTTTFSPIYFTKTLERDDSNPALEEFESAFRLRFDVDPDFYAYIGYDAANVLLETLKKVNNPAYLKEGLKKLTNYKGLITDVNFNGTHINQVVKVKGGQ